MRFITGLLLGIVLAISAPSTAADQAPGQGDNTPTPPETPELALGECSTAATSVTFTVTNKHGATRVVTMTVRPCGGGYTKVERYKSPWVPAQ